MKTSERLRRMGIVDRAMMDLQSAEAYMKRQNWYYTVIAANLAHEGLLSIGKDINGLQMKTTKAGSPDYGSKVTKERLSAAIPFALTWCKSELDRLVLDREQQ